MNRNMLLILMIIAVLAANTACTEAVKGQTLTDVLKYGNRTNMNSEVSFTGDGLLLTSDFYAFVGLIEKDTVIGFRITDMINEKYDWMGVTSNFLMNKMKIDFQDGTYSIIKPFQVEKSVISEGEFTYNEKQYFFKVDDFKKFDRPLKLLTFIDEKNNLSRVIFGCATPENGVYDLDHFVEAYLIPYEIGNLDVLPQIVCPLKINDVDIDVHFPTVFVNTKNAFCKAKSVTNCKCE